MPTVLSMCHGGIWRDATRVLMARAHGRASSYVISDIGAIEFGRWQASHFSWKMGATSLVNVTSPVPAACAETPARHRRPAPNPTRTIHHPDRDATAVMAPAPLVEIR